MVPALFAPSPQSTMLVSALTVSAAMASTTVASTPPNGMFCVALKDARVTPSWTTHWLPMHVLFPVQANAGPQPPQSLLFVRSSMHCDAPPKTQSVGAFAGHVGRQEYVPLPVGPHAIFGPHMPEQEPHVGLPESDVAHPLPASEQS